MLQVSGLSRNFQNIVHLRHLLTPHTTRSFVGNSFHPRLISLAIGSAEDLQAWVQGKLPSVTKIPDPATVRKNYVRFKREISDAFARKNYTPKSTLVEEPYRHIDYRALIMSPLEAPKVAQPTVGNVLPTYLTREVIEADLQKDASARLRVIGTPQFLKFLENSQLFQTTYSSPPMAPFYKRSRKFPYTRMQLTTPPCLCERPFCVPYLTESYPLLSELSSEQYN